MALQAFGMMLKFIVPDNKFNWRPEGRPYLIKRGDTLSKISKYVYSTFRRWRDIWNNNRPLIKNPNKIFSGFTVYYIPDDKNDKSDNSLAKGIKVKKNREPTSL